MQSLIPSQCASSVAESYMITLLLQDAKWKNPKATSETILKADVLINDCGLSRGRCTSPLLYNSVTGGARRIGIRAGGNFLPAALLRWFYSLNRRCYRSGFVGGEIL
ncbi:hypothetical protein GDO78_003874 [Eleutherodactylus coqui]|uniref:Uncharacterized protein n=1 Tax=Eleutherodactylus coqui TaxID=57060 RepID=A0A8J6EVF3_ELECQ|nr:hypothetical protein GDO78_003874 [Eleutherodactylus coqui]